MKALWLLVPALTACLSAGCSTTDSTADRSPAAAPMEQHTHYHVVMQPDGTSEHVSAGRTITPTGWQPDPSTPVPDGFYESGDQIVPKGYNPPNMHWTPNGWVPDGYHTAPSQGAAYPDPVYPYPYHPYTPYPVAAHWPYVVNHVHYHYHHLVPTPPGMLGRDEEGERR